MPSKKPQILIVDDDLSLCDILVNLLSYEGYDTVVANEGKSALQILKNETFDLMLLDLKLPDTSGVDLLDKAVKLAPGIQVVMISGQGTIDIAINATRKGAFDFLEKPLDSERVLVTLKNALVKGQLMKEKVHLLEHMKEQYAMIGRSEPINKVRTLIGKAAQNNSKVLIKGENGTGKELVARAIHMNSDRSGKPFIPVNCAAIPETLIESELFGHKKGAFTGATEDRPGRFQQAEGGTIFLDEVGDMSPMTQAKVLRTLEEDTVEMVGGNQSIPVDVRVIAATNKNLQEAMRTDQFREDLYFRLNVLTIKVPPLRDRKEDIPLLVDHFTNYFCDEHGIPGKNITSQATNRLMGYKWPGNVRELKNCIEKLMILVDKNTVGVSDVTGVLSEYYGTGQKKMKPVTFKAARTEFEKEFINERLIDCEWNITRAAELMGIPRTYLHKKINALGIRP